MDLREQLRAKVGAAARTIAADVEAELKRSAPVDSGELLNSINVTVTESAGGFDITIEATAEHAPYVRAFRWDETIEDLPTLIARVWASLG